MYTQENQPYSGIHLGTSQWTIGDSGCYVVSLTNILCLAGWPVAPPEVLAALEAAGGITGDGETVNAAVSRAFPQLRYDPNGEYAVVQLRNSIVPSEYHYEARGTDGTIYDPWTGTGNPPSGYRPTGYVQRMACDRRVEVTPGKTYDRFDTDLSYNDGGAYSAEVARVQSYLIDRGYMDRADLDWQGQVGAGSGWYGKKTSDAVDKFQKDHGIMADSTHHGWWYEHTRGAANNHLTV
jgi:hypothetical protein